MKGFIASISPQYIFMGTQTGFIINTYCTKCEFMCCETKNISEYMASKATLNAY